MNRNEFEQKRNSGELRWEKCSPYKEEISPHDVMFEKDWNPDTPGFWEHHGRSKEQYMDVECYRKPEEAESIEVNKCGDKYELVGDGAHRVAASRELNRPINVNVTGEYVEQSQSQDEEMEISV
ncbi:MAG: hypothetical protein LBM77_00940 [Spirochaetaceae bacterium]|jgi:hypothetical protein|nr:hypothetical protein [Spirochaetaceae bacterium]